jgi:glucose/arabinose dehydrogenase
LLLGALKHEELRLLDIDNGRVMHEEILLKNLGRVREAVIGPDGAIYVILDEPARIVQLTPRQERLQ